MGKVAGAQNFDGANWYEQHIAKRTRDALAEQDRAFAEKHAAWISWRPISGAAPAIGESPLPPSRSSVAVTSQSALAIGKMR